MRTAVTLLIPLSIATLCGSQSNAEEGLETPAFLHCEDTGDAVVGIFERAEGYRVVGSDKVVFDHVRVLESGALELQADPESGVFLYLKPNSGADWTLTMLEMGVVEQVTCSDISELGKDILEFSSQSAATATLKIEQLGSSLAKAQEANRELTSQVNALNLAVLEAASLRSELEALKTELKSSNIALSALQSKYDYNDIALQEICERHPELANFSFSIGSVELVPCYGRD